MLTKKCVLPNGVRILIEPLPHVQSAAIGLWCVTGSRHEREYEGGITHLIEHMLFKGTTTRTAKDIAESVEGRGGMLNAFTDKEMTCYYARTLSEDAPNAVDVLTDMVTNSLIDSDELERERNVVLEEIKRSEDEPDDLIHDLHFQNRWQGHPLGKPVIGTKESVSSFRRETILNYMARRYCSDNLVLAISGRVDEDAVLQIAGDRLGALPHSSDAEPVTPPSGHAGRLEIARDVEQVHFCIGSDAFSVHHDDLYPFIVMDSALGGGMSSRLFQEIREKRGLAYAVGSYGATYSIGGAHTVYGGTSLENWQAVQNLVREVCDDMMRNGLSADELERTKRHLKGGMLMSLENTSPRMMRLAKSEIYHGREIPVEETIEKIDAVTQDDILRVANEVLREDRVWTTAIGPF